MKRLVQMKEMLTSVVEGQMTHLESVDTKELGEAIDMIKDLAEAIYYCTVTEAMEEKEEEWDKKREEDWDRGRMYYDGRSSVPHDYRPTEREMPFGDSMRDRREGRSPTSRKMYMESREMHKDKATSLQELEKYAQELTSDLIEMVEGASPEEKQFLSNKIAALATKIK
jgi:hypothetical protein